jgi:SAM-dependent methyltransferase
MNKIQFAEYAPGAITVIEGHLGGYYTRLDPPSHCPEMFKYLIDTFNVKSVLDVGCGMGYQMQEFMKYCDEVVGIDGSVYALENSPVKEHIFQHDFTVGELETDDRFDLCWCCEFVEHVEEQFRDNFLSTFSFCNYVAMTHAVPGQGGHHHVNCQPKEYWIRHMNDFGFEFDEEITNKLKKMAGEGKHFYSTGLFFRKKTLKNDL